MANQGSGDCVCQLEKYVVSMYHKVVVNFLQD